MRLTEFSHGAGCGCKLSPDELSDIIAPLRSHPAMIADALLVGTETSDDGSVWRLPSGELLVQSVDFFTPVVDDPYDWGRIAAANALSDIYAMSGTPLTALQLVAWPRQLGFAQLTEVLKGGAAVMAEAGTTIVGGHSIDDPEPKYGFAVTGLATRPVTNSDAQVGDLLVLTKPLGVGIITTAIKRQICPPEVAQAALDSMVRLNREAALAMHAVGARACTDITGYGLLGHLREMVAGSGVAAELDVKTIPIIAGTEQLLKLGCFPGGSKRNLDSVAPVVDQGSVSEALMRVLADAQTSGGLLISAPPRAARDLVGKIGPPSAVIGRIVDRQSHLDQPLLRSGPIQNPYRCEYLLVADILENPRDYYVNVYNAE